MEHLAEMSAYTGVNGQRRRTAETVNKGGTAGIPVPWGIRSSGFFCAMFAMAMSRAKPEDDKVFACEHL